MLCSGKVLESSCTLRAVGSCAVECLPAVAGPPHCRTLRRSTPHHRTLEEEAAGSVTTATAESLRKT